MKLQFRGIGLKYYNYLEIKVCMHFFLYLNYIYKL